MTPRERAEEIRQHLLAEYIHPVMADRFNQCVGDILAEHVRALLADDAATIEITAQAAWRKADECEQLQAGFYEELRIAMRAALAALRRKAGAE